MVRLVTVDDDDGSGGADGVGVLVGGGGGVGVGGLTVLVSWRGSGGGEGVNQRLLWFPPPSLAAQQGVCSHRTALSLVAGRHGCDISPFLRY